jgi:N-acetylglucosamine kinase-like BadF-type ATPase
MIENTFFIGIDSGGTKCELVISGIASKTIYKKIYGALHYSVHGKSIITDHLTDIIKDSLTRSKLNSEDCKGICIGLSGARENKDKTELQGRLKKSLGIKNVIVESDAVTALHGAFEGKDGLILICGTGSILYGEINKKILRIGGWGRIIGDRGSGYEIGINAVRYLAEEYDRGSSKSKLAIRIREKFSLNGDNIVEQIYHKKFAIQNLVPLVLELAGKKDRDALKITQEAVNGLLYHIDMFFSRTGYRKKISLAFSGSIIESDNALTKILKQKIKRYYKNINLTGRLHSPAEGAILLAKNKYLKN